MGIDPPLTTIVRGFPSQPIPPRAPKRIGVLCIFQNSVLRCLAAAFGPAIALFVFFFSSGKTFLKGLHDNNYIISVHRCSVVCTCRPVCSNAQHPVLSWCAIGDLQINAIMSLRRFTHDAIMSSLVIVIINVFIQCEILSVETVPSACLQTSTCSSTATTLTVAHTTSCYNYHRHYDHHHHHHYHYHQTDRQTGRQAGR